MDKARYNTTSACVSVRTILDPFLHTQKRPPFFAYHSFFCLQYNQTQATLYLELRIHRIATMTETETEQFRFRDEGAVSVASTAEIITRVYDWTDSNDDSLHLSPVIGLKSFYSRP